MLLTFPAHKIWIIFLLCLNEKNRLGKDGIIYFINASLNSF